MWFVSEVSFTTVLAAAPEDKPDVSSDEDNQEIDYEPPSCFRGSPFSVTIMFPAVKV